MGSLVGVLRMVRVVRVVNGHGGELCKNLNENTGNVVCRCLVWYAKIARMNWVSYV